MRKLNREQTSDLSDWFRRLTNLLPQLTGNKADAYYWLATNAAAVMTEYALGTQVGDVYRNINEGVDDE